MIKSKFPGIHQNPDIKTLFIQIIVPWLLIYAALFLRVYKADFYPIHNESDSIKYVWAGNSLFRNFFKPITNTIFVAELDDSIIWRSDYNFFDTVRRFRFHLVEPFLDTPPLGMMFFAIPAYLFGYVNFSQIPPILYMLPAVIMSIFSLFFTFLLAKKLFGIGVGYLALIVYGFSPIFIYSHRLAFQENIITPILIITLYLLYSYLDSPKTYQFIWLLVVSALGLWIKLPAIWFGLIIFFWMIVRGKIKQAFSIALATLVSLALYVTYGMVVDSHQFLTTLQIQGNRGMDINAFFTIVTKPDFYQPFHDGIYLIGFISIFAMLIAKQGNNQREFISINFILWLLIIILTTNKTNNFFWYRIPLYPFMSISIAYFIQRLFKDNQNLVAVPFLVLGFFGLDTLNLDFSNNVLRILFMGLFGFGLAPLIFKNSKIMHVFGKAVFAILLVLILGLNIFTAIKYPGAQCLDDNCLMPDKIVVNE